MDKSETIIKVCGIEKESIVDGPGFRYVLFVQGCPHRCPGCHNPESHDPEGGTEMTVSEIFGQIMEIPHLRGVTCSGGEPFEQVDALLELAQRIKETNLTLMSYTGYTYEELIARNDEATNKLLSLLNILVDGPYDKTCRNLTLQYRGSENQRVLYINGTKKSEYLAED